MTRPTRFCRLAWMVDDMDAVVKQLHDLFGLGMRFASVAPDLIQAGIDEHGLEPIKSFVPVDDLPFMRGLPYPLVEIALAVDDCEETYRRLEKEGILPSFTSPLPGPDTQEHLYAEGFDGIPFLSCTDGDNEMMMDMVRPFLDLERAPPPKIGVVTLLVDDIDKTAKLLARSFDMRWVETDAGGLGERALVGPHRVKLVQTPSAAVRANALRCLASAEMMFEDPDVARGALERAGYPVLAERTFASGRKGWYFGAVISGLPLSVYDVRDDDEARGIA